MSLLVKCWRCIPMMLSSGAFRPFRGLTSQATYVTNSKRKARRISRTLQDELKTNKRLKEERDDLKKRLEDVQLEIIILKVKYLIDVLNVVDSLIMAFIGTNPSPYGDFMHANIDIGLIMSEEPREEPVEEPEYGRGSIATPEDIFHTIDHFCLGKPLLHVSGRDVTLPHGWPWLSIGPALTNSNSYFNKNQEDYLTERIEEPLPKSRPTKSKRNGPGGRGRNSRGAGNRTRIGNRGRGSRMRIVEDNEE